MDLCGVAEIAQLIGVTRSRASQLAAQRDFPEPVARLAAGPVWRTADVEEWARASGRL